MMSEATSVDSPLVKKIITLGALSVGYLLLSFLLVGFQPDQLVLIALVNSLYFASSLTRKFVTAFSIFLIYWIVFDYMKAFPNYHYNVVHIESLYLLEKKLFGIQYDSLLVTPNEYWQLNRTVQLNVITGLFYLLWVPVPLLVATYFFFTNQRIFYPFALTFVLTNVLGFILYYLYPAAPPWYVQQFGFAFHPSTPGNTAGLADFDAYFGVSIFKSIYAKSSNVFAAMPSLHSSYPVIVLYYGLKNRLGLINLFFAVVTAGIWFSAVYNSHHYVLDVLAGAVCAVVGINLFNLLAKTSSVTGLIQWLMSQTSLTSKAHLRQAKRFS
jgi:inositol phosphorylceramide synthase catalytic subunit